MFLVNIDHIPGTNFEVLGLVKGTVVQCKDFGHDFVAGLRGFVGGEITEYTAMLCEAREIATERMEREAELLGADAVINVRYCTSEIMSGTAEIMVYGTAVRYR